MKKLVNVLVVIVCILSLVGCGEELDQNTSKATFQATILEISNEILLVEPVKGSKELKSVDKIHVSMKNMELLSKLEVGDIIEITYNGEIEESYPAGLGEVYRIKVIE